MPADLPGKDLLSEREVATLLAALLFWKEEVAQAGDFTARPYLKSIGMAGVTPLSIAEIEQLSARLRTFRATS